MMDMRAGGAVAFTDGWKPVQNAQLMLKALEYVRSFDGLLLQLPMDAGLSAGALMHEGPQSTRLGMPGSPAIAEEIFLHRDIELLRYTGSRLHITGLSTRGSVELVRRAKKDGLRITASVTPYHLLLTDDALVDYDSMYRVTPPLRSEDDRQALIEGLLDDTIDAITSHHRPQDWDSKNKEFEYAGEGMAIQQWMFPLLYTALGEMLGLPVIIRKLTYGPAAVLGTVAETGYTIFDPTLPPPAGPLSISFNQQFPAVNLLGAVLQIHP
jgi:dihydroorotase